LKLQAKSLLEGKFKHVALEQGELHPSKFLLAFKSVANGCHEKGIP
jgi:hypothetical protein